MNLNFLKEWAYGIEKRIVFYHRRIYNANCNEWTESDFAGH